MAVLEEGIKMRFNFIHRPPRKGKQRRWYDNPFWGPLSIAMIGAFIVAFAQITTTILPIYFGPSDACDFSIALEPFSDTITIDNNTIHIEKNITVKDLHSIIKPYHHPVYVKIIGLIPKGVTVSLDGKGGLLPLNIKMTIEINEKEYDPGDHEIKIQGIGEDGITRNCIYFLNLKEGHREYNFGNVGNSIDNQEYNFGDFGNSIGRI